jgi:hypothetical protein
VTFMGFDSKSAVVVHEELAVLYAQVVTSQRSDRTHAAAKQPVPMATPMAGTRNQ